MLKNDVPFHWVLVTNCTSQFLEHVHIVNCIDSFISGQEITNGGGGSWWTTVKEIGDVPFTIFEVFHPLSHTAGTHTDSPSNSITAFWQNDTSFMAILLQWIMDDMHVFSLYFSLQKTDTTIDCITASLIMLIKHA
jgi:hypothetical protein